MTDQPRHPDSQRPDSGDDEERAAAPVVDPWSRSAETAPLPADNGWASYAPPGYEPAYEPPAYAAPDYGPAESESTAQYGSQQYQTPQYGAQQYETPQYGAPKYTAGQSQTQYQSSPYQTSDSQSSQAEGGAYAASAGQGDGNRRRGGWLPLLLVALLASLIGGGIGTAVTLANDDDDVAPDRQVAASSARASAPPVATAPSTSAPAQSDAPVPAAIREIVPGSVASIAQALLPSVVEIAVATPRGGGSGSGVVIRDDGYILTNNHVVSDATQIRVFIGPKIAQAKLIGTDPANDLAVIQAIDAGPLAPASIGTVNGLKVGDPVVAIGSPLGLSGTVTSGIISALDRRVDVPSEDGRGRESIYGAIQTDAAINPGNSGGALVDGNGRLIGINSAIASLGSSAGGVSGSIGLGFAIPVDLAINTANQLITTGKAVHPYIGVNVGSIDEDAAAQLSIPAGALLKELVPGGPAAKAGLQPNDVITKIEGTEITSADQLVARIRQQKVGDKVTVTYNRRGTEGTASLLLVEKPPE